jgi:phosphate transport system permease protein
VPFLRDSIRSPFTVLPIQTFTRVSRPQAECLQHMAAATIVRLVLLLTMNAIAIWLRDCSQQQRTA